MVAGPEASGREGSALGHYLDVPMNPDAWLLVKLAADKKQADLSMLLKTKVNPNSLVQVEWREYASCPLFEAAVSGHTRITRMLLAAGADVNVRVGPGYTPLYNAAYQGHSEVVKLLIQSGAEVNIMTDYNFSPLYIAAQEGHHNCVKLLLSEGAEADGARPDEGATPLYIASQNGHWRCVEHLLDEGATIDLPMFDGSTPLMIACYFAHVRVVEMLLRAGASLSIYDRHGRNALDWAKKRGDNLIVALVQEENSARLQGGVGGWAGSAGSWFGGAAGASDGGGGWFGLGGNGGSSQGCFGGVAACMNGGRDGFDAAGSPSIGVGASRTQSRLAKESAAAGWCRCLACCLPQPERNAR
jgi:hypothetical protein